MWPQYLVFYRGSPREGIKKAELVAPPLVSVHFLAGSFPAIRQKPQKPFIGDHLAGGVGLHETVTSGRLDLKPNTRLRIFMA